MLRAITADGKIVTLAKLPKREIEALRKKEQFFCPSCKETVIVRAGPQVIPHFAHLAHTNCSQHEGGEGKYHLQGKLQLYHWLLNQNIPTELEAFIPEINQRPDLFIQTKKNKIAIEYQCVTIPLSVIRKRNKGYRKANIVPIWILGAKQLVRTSTNRIKVSSFTRQFLHQFSTQFPTTLFYFCPHKKIFSIVNDIIFTSSQRAIAMFTCKLLHRFSFKELLSANKISTKKLWRLWHNEKRSFRLNRQKAYGNELVWRNWLYEKKLHIEQLPSVVHLPTRSQYLMNVPPWNWQSRFIVDFLHPLQVGDIFTTQQANSFLQPYIAPKNDYPLLHFDHSPVKEYLSHLARLNIIHRLSSATYMKSRSIHFFHYIEESLKGDDALLQAFMYNRT